MDARLTTLGSDRASSKGYIVRWVEAPSNKLLTTAFEASLESVTVTCRLSVDSKIAGIAKKVYYVIIKRCVAIACSSIKQLPRFNCE